jgi:hypothetical protein
MSLSRFWESPLQRQNLIMVTDIAQPRKNGSPPRIGGNVKWALDPVNVPTTPKTMKQTPIGMEIHAHILSKVFITLSAPFLELMRDDVIQQFVDIVFRHFFVDFIVDHDRRGVVALAQTFGIVEGEPAVGGCLARLNAELLG